MNTTKIICTVIYIIFIVATFFSIEMYIDINSFIFVIVVGGLYAFSVKGEIPIYKNLEMVL